jgi:hypothetical protein
MEVISIVPGALTILLKLGYTGNESVSEKIRQKHLS